MTNQRAKHGGRKLAVAETCPCEPCEAYRERRRQQQRDAYQDRAASLLPPSQVSSAALRPNGQACSPRCQRGACGVCDGHRDADAAYMRARRAPAAAVAAILPSPDEKWRDDALCSQTDPEAFFPEKGGSTREAKRICHRCPVAAECLEYAIAAEERFGVWGGYSERERREIARGRRVA